MESLQRAVADLYARFERYPLRPYTEPCEHCFTRDEERVLHGRTIRQLSPQELAQFAESAMLTWGDTADLKHFLPRIFEVVATGDFGWPDLEVVYAKLRHADWRTWPDDEVQAVERYLLAKWRHVLAAYPPQPAKHDADTTLCALAQAADELEPFLAAWLDAPGEAPARHLASFVWDSAPGLTTGSGFGSAFWGDRRAQQEQVRRWIVRAPVLQRLEGAFFDASSEEAATALSKAVEVLGVLVR